MNSKQKGKRGELELANLLTSYGYQARRGQQFKGTEDSPDIECPRLRAYHIECKRVEKLSLDKAMIQASADAGTKVPVVIHKRNRGDWLVTMSLENFLSISYAADPLEEWMQ